MTELDDFAMNLRYALGKEWISFDQAITLFLERLAHEPWPDDHPGVRSRSPDGLPDRETPGGAA